MALCVRRTYMIGWGLLIVFAVLAYTSSWWFLLGVAALALWKANRWYYYSSRPWRKVHFPMMRAYAAASGIESAQANREGRAFDVKTALLNLLKMVNPKVSLDYEALIQREFERHENFYDGALMQEYLLKRKNLSPDQAASMLEKIRELANTPDNGLMVRMVIASVIEDQFSALDRGEYLFQVFSGQAN